MVFSIFFYFMCFFMGIVIFGRKDTRYGWLCIRDGYRIYGGCVERILSSC